MRIIRHCLVACLFLLPGYAGLPPSRTEKHAQSSQNATVLIHVLASWNGHATDPRKLFSRSAREARGDRSGDPKGRGDWGKLFPTDAHDGLGSCLTDLDTRKPVFGKRLPRGHDAGVWISFEVPPGSDHFGDLVGARDNYWLRSPEGQSILYAGTLNYQCSGKRFIQGRWIHTATSSLSTELEATASLAQTMFGQSATLSL